MGKIYLGVSKCFAFYKNTKSFVFNKTSILNLISANYICVEILLWLIAFIFNDIEFLKKKTSPSSVERLSSSESQLFKLLKVFSEDT